MKLRTLVHAGTALAAATALSAVLCAGAMAGTFNVTTNITASCVISSGGPSNLSPTYDPISNVSVGSATTLVTTCTGLSPSVAFSDPSGSGTTVFSMNNGRTSLNYQISNTTSCSGILADGPITEGAPISLGGGGANILNICAAVTIGQQTATAGAYSDVVTYTITP